MQFLCCFLGIGRNTVTLPTSKVIPNNFLLRLLIVISFSESAYVSYNLDKCAMDRTKQNYTISSQNSEAKKFATTC